MRTDAAVGKLYFNRCSGSDRGRAAQRPARRIAHQREAARQYAAIRKCCQQLAAPFGARLPPGEELAHRAPRAFGKGIYPLTVAGEPRAMDGNISGDPCPQPQGDRAVALAPAFDSAAHQLLVQPHADLREGDMMAVGVGAQRARQSGCGMVEPLSRQGQHLVGIRQRPRRRTQLGPPRLLIAQPRRKRPPRQ